MLDNIAARAQPLLALGQLSQRDLELLYGLLQLLLLEQPVRLVAGRQLIPAAIQLLQHLRRLDLLELDQQRLLQRLRDDPAR